MGEPRFCHPSIPPRWPMSHAESQYELPRHHTNPTTETDQIQGQKPGEKKRGRRIDSNGEKFRRKRKNQAQVDRLLEHFVNDPFWDVDKKVEIANELGMSYTQVGKWHWDKKKETGMFPK